jgi:hypothetical protein
LLPDAVNLLPDAVNLLPDAVNRRQEAVNLLSDAVKPGIQCVRTRWIRGFMAFWLVPAHPDRGADGVGVT